MKNFIQWAKGRAIQKDKKKKDKNDNISNNQGGSASRNSNHKGQTSGFDQEIAEPVVHVFTEP